MSPLQSAARTGIELALHASLIQRRHVDHELSDNEVIKLIRAHNKHAISHARNTPKNGCRLTPSPHTLKFMYFINIQNKVYIFKKRVNI